MFELRAAAVIVGLIWVASMPMPWPPLATLAGIYWFAVEYDINVKH